MVTLLGTPLEFFESVTRRARSLTHDDGASLPLSDRANWRRTPRQCVPKRQLIPNFTVEMVSFTLTPGTTSGTPKIVPGNDKLSVLKS